MKILILLLSALIISNTSNSKTEALINAQNAEMPNFNMLYASNINIISRLGMNFMSKQGKHPKACINTVTSFFDSHNTCSSCQHFVKNPHKWNFSETNTPNIGDIVIYFKGDLAYHAAIIVSTNPIKINHAVGENYLKNRSLPKNIKYKYYTYNN